MWKSAPLTLTLARNPPPSPQAWFETGVGRFVGVLDADSDGATADSLTAGAGGNPAGDFTASASEWLTSQADDARGSFGFSFLGGEGGGEGGGDGAKPAESTHLYIQMEYCPR